MTEFPEMLEKRPLVCFTDVDGKYVVLGGNQRLKAAQHVKLKQLPIVLCDDWTEEQKEMFLYRDNISAGSWDWETVSEWGKEELKDWGEELEQKEPPIDYSILVYPAWRNIHGVTPIIPTHNGGYRNSLVFYPLKAFVGLD